MASLIVNLLVHDPSVKLFKNTGEGIRQTEYASIIGSLRYATIVLDPT